MGSKAQAATRREKVIRVLFSIGGALGAAVLALLVAVATPFAIDWIRGGSVTASSDPVCPSEARDPSAGQEFVDVVLRPIRQGEDGDCFTRSLDKPGDTFTVRVQYGNYTTETARDVTINASVPDGVEQIAGTTEILNANNPGGAKVSDGILTSGLNIGSYTAGSNALIVFDV